MFFQSKFFHKSFSSFQGPKQGLVVGPDYRIHWWHLHLGSSLLVVITKIRVRKEVGGSGGLSWQQESIMRTLCPGQLGMKNIHSKEICHNDRMIFYNFLTSMWFFKRCIKDMTLAYGCYQWFLTYPYPLHNRLEHCILLHITKTFVSFVIHK